MHAEENGGESEPLPCAILSDADAAAALEASLIENVARLDPEEVTRWETFTPLVRVGRSPEDIALTFGLTDMQVKRTLALGNLAAHPQPVPRRADRRRHRPPPHPRQQSAAARVAGDAQ